MEYICKNIFVNYLISFFLYSISENLNYTLNINTTTKNIENNLKIYNYEHNKFRYNTLYILPTVLSVDMILYDNTYINDFNYHLLFLLFFYFYSRNKEFVSGVNNNPIAFSFLLFYAKEISYIFKVTFDTFRISVFTYMLIHNLIKSYTIYIYDYDF